MLIRVSLVSQCNICYSVIDDVITELKSSSKQLKLGNGVHRNHSYYIAMNRSGQRGERHPKSTRPSPKSLFYRPNKDPPIPEQSTEIARPSGEEKPKIVIASYTHASKVSTPARAFCISSRPSSTVAEPTSSMSTDTHTRSSRSTNAENPLDISPPRQSDPTRSKRPPASLSIPKGTPPPPPPRTSRPSPYAKQFPNYLPANAVVALRKTDSTFSDHSDNSEVVSAFPSSRRIGTSEVKILSSTEVKKENKEQVKPNVLPAKKSVDSKPATDHHADVTSDNLTDDEGGEESFLREGFGRQSMSEKRFKLAQVDITQTEFYKKRVTRSKSLEGTYQLLSYEFSRSSVFSVNVRFNFGRNTDG